MSRSKTWFWKRCGVVAPFEIGCLVIVTEMSHDCNIGVVEWLKMVEGEIRKRLWKKMAGKVRIFECESHREAYELARLMNRQVIVRIGKGVFRVQPNGAESDVTAVYDKFFGGSDGEKAKAGKKGESEGVQTRIPGSA